MNVVDKLVKEWAWRCDKGYPDINNPKDKEILDKLLKEWGIELPTYETKIIKEEDVEDLPYSTLIDLLNSKKDELTPKQKAKLFNIIKKTGKGLSSTLYDKLLKKGLGEEQASVIVGYADRKHIEDQILESLSNTSNTFSKLGTEGNLASKLSSISDIDRKFVEELLNFTTPKGTKAVGRGELALATLLNDTSMPNVGDIGLSDGTLIEIKATGTSGAIVAPDDITRGDSKFPLSKIKEHFSEKDFPNISEIFQMKRITWPVRLEVYFEKYIDNNELKEKFFNTLSSFIKDVYKNYVTLTKNELEGTFSSVNLKTLISKKLALAYLKEKEVMFISSNNDFILLEGATIENYIGREITIGGFSDALPRLEYRKV